MTASTDNPPHGRKMKNQKERFCQTMQPAEALLLHMI